MYGGLHVLGMNFRLHWSLLTRDDANFLSPILIIRREFDLALGQGEKGVIAARPHIGAGMHARAALSHDDCAGQYELAVKTLDAQPLGLGITTILRASTALLMCHAGSLPAFAFLPSRPTRWFGVGTCIALAFAPGGGLVRLSGVRRAGSLRWLFDVRLGGCQRGRPFRDWCGLSRRFRLRFD